MAVGLNERSVLLCETYRDPVDGRILKRFSSSGADPVLVFGPRGERHEMEPQSEILLEGSKFYECKPQLATRAEIVELERLPIPTTLVISPAGRIESVLRGPVAAPR